MTLTHTTYNVIAHVPTDTKEYAKNVYNLIYNTKSKYIIIIFDSGNMYWFINCKRYIKVFMHDPNICQTPYLPVR